MLFLGTWFMVSGVIVILAGFFGFCLIDKLRRSRESDVFFILGTIILGIGFFLR